MTPSWFLATIFDIGTFGTFSNTRQFTECKNVYLLILGDFLKIKSRKSANLDCAAVFEYFPIRSSTKFQYY
jgi:hypothetical protein